jgi:hypothetical protein
MEPVPLARLVRSAPTLTISSASVSGTALRKSRAVVGASDRRNAGINFAELKVIPFCLPAREGS